MGKRDPRVDDYIAKQADFARRILVRLRAAVHRSCPQVEETIKWRMPTFLYHGMLAGMAGFKQHCAFGFWKSKLILDPSGKPADNTWGSFGRIQTLSDLPAPKVFAGYIRKAMELNEQGVKTPRARKTARRPLPMPADLRAALVRHARARATFEGFRPSHRREYIEWIVAAKREETRTRRLATAIEWLTAGKPYNWKYLAKAGR